MNKKKLKKIQDEVSRLRGNPTKPRVFEQLAKKLGREISARGKEPNWVSGEFDYLRPVSIPHHGGKDLSPGVSNTILNALEEDIYEWQDRLESEND